MSERAYFLAHGKSETKVREFFTKRQAAMIAADDIAKEVGGNGTVGAYRISGILFKDGAPEGWTKKGVSTDGQYYYMPLRRSKAGKALCQRISSIRIPGASDLHSEFSRDGGHMSSNGLGITINYISAEIVRGKAIITVPSGMDFVPPESTPLKMSEYWTLKEPPPLHEWSGE